MFSIPVPKGKACRPRSVQELKNAYRKAQEAYDEESKPLVSIIGQIRSIEKDLKESNVNTAFTREVYECHIRLALEDGSVRDFAVTMNELEKLYETEGSSDELEMLSYAVMYFILYDLRQEVERILEKASFFVKSDPCFDFAQAFAKKWLNGTPTEELLKEAEGIEVPGHLQYAIQWFTDESVLSIVVEAKKREANQKLAKERLEAARLKKLKALEKNSDEDSENDSLKPGLKQGPKGDHQEVNIPRVKNQQLSEWGGKGAKNKHPSEWVGKGAKNQYPSKWAGKGKRFQYDIGGDDDEDDIPPPKKKFHPEWRGKGKRPQFDSGRGYDSSTSTPHRPGSSNFDKPAGLGRNDSYDRGQRDFPNRGRGRRDDFHHAYRGDDERSRRDYDTEKGSRNYRQETEDPYDKPVGYFRSADDPYESYGWKSSKDYDVDHKKASSSTASLWDRR